MSKSSWRTNYRHLVGLIEGVSGTTQSQPDVPFHNARGEWTNSLEDIVGRNINRRFRLFVDVPAVDDGSTGIARRRVMVEMALDILYSRDEEGEIMAGEDSTLIESVLRLSQNMGRPDTTLLYVRPFSDPEVVELGEDGPSGGLLFRYKFDVIYVEDNTP